MVMTGMTMNSTMPCPSGPRKAAVYTVQYTIQNTVQLITYDIVPLKRPYIFGIYLQDN